MLNQDREIAALTPPEGKDRIVCAVKSRYGSGLSVEARFGRPTKSWLYRYYIAGKQQKMTLGNYPAMSLAEARQAHKEAIALVDRGIDPRLQKAEEKAANEAVLTVRVVVERWLDFREETGDLKPLTLLRHRQRWERHLKKHLENVRLSDLTTAHLAQALELARRGSKPASGKAPKSRGEEIRKALTTISLALDYARIHHLIPNNPARLLRPKDFNIEARTRERWLTIPELRQLWQAIDGELANQSELEGAKRFNLISPSAAAAIKLLILTGARRGEVAQMQRSQVVNGVWTIPETKNGRAHTVYLSQLALDIIQTQRSGEFVFESARTPGKPILEDSITRALRRLQARLMLHMEPFTVHDLRRSAATNWAERLGAEERIIEVCLNHQPVNKLVRIYHRSKHEEKTRELWLRWGELVASEIALRPV